MAATATANKTKDDRQAKQDRLAEQAKEQLEQLKEEINGGHDEIKALMTDGRDRAVRLGKLLTEARGQVNLISTEKGRWRKWVEEHCRFTMRTAQYYVRIARNEDRFAADEKINVSRAIYLLTVEDKPPKAPGKTRKRSRSAIQEGMKKYNIKASWKEMTAFLKSIGVKLAKESAEK